MATNLQVNAQTSQAVGAFNQLAGAIANARGKWAQFNTTISSSSTAIAKFGGQMRSNVGSVFDGLTSAFDKLATAIKVVSAGIAFVFTSLLRELDKLQGFNAIMSVTTKNSGEAANAYEFLRKTADKLGIQFDSLTSNYAKLVAALPEGADKMAIAEKTFLGISMAARTLHASNQDIQLMFYAVTQIASKGVVSMEELRRQLGEKLPGAMSIAARAFNTTTDELEKAIRKGIVNSEKFLKGFGDELIRTFGDSSQKASESVSAAINRLTNVWVDFSKQVLDSGAGQSIINVFDALREKLSDPVLIERFANFIKYLADRFTDFIKNISSQDIQNGFDMFTKGTEALVNIFGKLIELLNWVINNAPKAGAILGGVGGAAAGAVFGPVGMAIGAAGGAAAGAFAGQALSPTKNDLHATRTQRELAEFQANQKALQQQELLLNSVIPKLQQFKNVDPKRIQSLLKVENATAKLLTDLSTIQFSDMYKTDKDRTNALYEYAKTGVVLGPKSTTLQDILNTKGGKKSPEDKALDATQSRGFGFTSTFFKEWERLNTLFKSGRMNLDELTNAQGRLLDKQPVIQEYNRQQEQFNREQQKQLQANIDLAFREVAVREQITEQLDMEQYLAGLRTDDQRIQGEYLRIINQAESNGVTLSREKKTEIMNQIVATDRLRQVVEAENRIVAGTVDKYREQVLMAEAIRRLRADPASGVTDTMISDYVVTSDPNMAGSQQYLDAQKRALEEYYAYINMLRGLDVINEQTAEQAKYAAFVQANEARLNQLSGFYGNLATLQKVGSRKLAAVGKAAAITQATIDAYLAINRALATIPPPMSYVVAAGIGAAAFANVRSIASTKGFWTGGYTGDGASTSIAGVTHGQEFVVNRSATAKNREVLEAMNRGQSINAGGGVHVSIENYGSSKTFEIQPISANEVRIIARDEARSVVAAEAPAVIAADLDNPNSRTSKSMSRNVRAMRNRG